MSEDTKTTQEQETPPRKDGAPYRPLTIPERDMLFAIYEKHNGNMTAVSRDPECKFRAYSMIRYWASLYNFESRLVEIKRKRAEKHIEELQDAKLEALKRARELVAPRLMPLIDAKGSALTNPDGTPAFYEAPPDPRGIKTAWEIIKVELNEPTFINRSEINNPQAEEVRQALDLIERLAHGKPPTDTNAVQGERQAAGSAPEVPPAVRDDIPQETPKN